MKTLLIRTTGFLVALFAIVFSLWADYIIQPKTAQVSRGIKRIQQKDGTEYIARMREIIKMEDGIDLSGQRLSGFLIHWEEKTLKNLNFSKCDLYGADFSQTSFENCNFSNADLRKAIFDGYLTGCDFTGATILGATIGGMDAEQLKSTKDYKNQYLVQTHFRTYSSDFSGVDFSNVDLSYSSFHRVRLENCDFTDARIKGSSFNDLRYKAFKKFDYDFKIVQLLMTKDFKEGFVEGLEVTELIWPEDQVVNLSSMIFVNCKLGAENQAKIDLTDSVISGCDFRDFKGLTLENVKSTWNYKHGRMEGILLPEEIQQALDAEKNE